MPIRLCLEPRCPQQAVYRGRCGAHATTRNRQTRSRNTHVYNSRRWKLLRRAYLFDHPLCETEGCDLVATDVHHRHAIQDGGPAWEYGNLEALCHAHHSQITRREQVESGTT